MDFAVHDSTNCACFLGKRRTFVGLGISREPGCSSRSIRDTRSSQQTLSTIKWRPTTSMKFLTKTMARSKEHYRGAERAVISPSLRARLANNESKGTMKEAC